jgi:release factor glutamine methyltransferase
MAKLYEVLRRASLFLETQQREPKVAELLLQHYLQVSRAAFFTMMQDEVPASIEAKVEEDVRKHAETGVPLQHLTGKTEFYGRHFSVNEHVLIPRMETEELVQHAIREAKKWNRTDTPLTIVDVGTGSGVIAITLKLELECATVFATDISEVALRTAKQNAAQLEADVIFLQGDFLTPFNRENIQADMIVSNPPYIARKEKPLLADTVKDFDPEIALFAGEDGLAAYSKLIAQSPSALKKNGLLAFEIGHEQGEEVRQLIRNTYPDSAIKIIKDINEKNRIVSAKLAAK